MKAADAKACPTNASPLISWRHVLFAPLIFSFQRTIALSPSLACDAVATAENPILFFGSYVVAALLACLVCLSARARKTLNAAPVAVPLLLLVLGTLLTCAQILLGTSSAALRIAGGFCVGLATTEVFLMWCTVLSRLNPKTLVCTVCISHATAYGMSLVMSLGSHGAVESLVYTLGAISVSTIPLEALRRASAAETSSKAIPDPVPPSEKTRVGNVPSAWWPFLSAAFVAYSITGFSWGNALFNQFDYLNADYTSITTASSLIGCGIAFLFMRKHSATSLSTWPLLVCVSLLLAGWLVLITLGEATALLTASLAGVAFGLLDPLLLAWACLAPRREGIDPISAGALAWNALLAPIALGILLIPPLKGAAATLVSPLAGVAFLVTYQTRGIARHNPTSKQRPIRQQLEDSLEHVAQQAGLSPREHDVFLMLAHGHSSSYIAEQLGVSAYTVKTHVKHIYSKLDVHSKDEFLASLADISDGPHEHRASP